MESYYDQSYGPIVSGAFYPLMGDHNMTKMSPDQIYLNIHGQHKHEPYCLLSVYTARCLEFTQ